MPKSLAVGLIILFLSSFFYTHLTSLFTQKQSELTALNMQLQNIKSAVNTVRSEIAIELDLDQIEQIAIEQLGMQKPLPNQIVYLEIPEEGYTTYGN